VGEGGVGERNQYSNSLQAGRSGVEPPSPARARSFPFPVSVQIGPGAHPAPFRRYQRCPLGIMRPGVGVHHTPRVAPRPDIIRAVTVLLLFASMGMLRGDLTLLQNMRDPFLLKSNEAEVHVCPGKNVVALVPLSQGA
jgi:hypothetical protein